jgi:hypothetical protein
MLWTITVLLVLFWFIGLVTAFTLGGLIHLFLAAAIVMVLVNVIQGRKAV